MYEFKYVSQDWVSPRHTVTKTVDSVYLPEIYEAFDEFLRGCGFTLPDEVTECDCECPEDVTEPPQMDGSVEDNRQFRYSAVLDDYVEWPG